MTKYFQMKVEEEEEEEQEVRREEDNFTSTQWISARS